MTLETFHVAWDRSRPHLPYAIGLTAALALRVVDLGGRPLGYAEAAASWSAWTAAAGRAPVLPMLADPPQSALLHALQSMFFWLLGSGDATARLPVALAATLPILLVWFLSAPLGRVESIVLAALLAVDPLSVGWARVADGAALTATAVWAVILCATVIAAPGAGARQLMACRYGLWIAAGVLLVSGPLAWDVLVPLTLLVAMWRQGPGDEDLPLRTCVAMVAMAALVAGSAAFTRLEALQFASSAATRWLRDWDHESGTSLHEIWTACATLGIVSIGLGLGGIVLGAISNARRFIPLIVWLLWAVLVTIRPGRSLTSWLVLQPPLLLGASYLLSRVAAAGFGIQHSASSMDTNPRFRAAWIVAVLLAMLGTGRAVQVASDRDAQRFRPYADVTEQGVRYMTADLAELLSPDQAQLEVIAPLAADPVVGWQLRAAPGVRWVAAASLRPGRNVSYILIPSSGGERFGGSSDVYPLPRRGGTREHVLVLQNRGVR